MSIISVFKQSTDKMSFVCCCSPGVLVYILVDLDICTTGWWYNYVVYPKVVDPYMFVQTANLKDLF